MKKPIIYLASGYGFSEAGRAFYYDKLIPLINSIGFQILDPWRLVSPILFTDAAKLAPGEERVLAFKKANLASGGANVNAIIASNIVFAALDGSDIDSGVATEIGIAYAKGKIIVGYRGDLRRTGENDGALINLQVQYCIESSHVCSAIINSLEALERYLRSTYKAISMGVV